MSPRLQAALQLVLAHVDEEALTDAVESLGVRLQQLHDAREGAELELHLKVHAGAFLEFRFDRDDRFPSRRRRRRA